MRGKFIVSFLALALVLCFAGTLFADEGGSEQEIEFGGRLWVGWATTFGDDIDDANAFDIGRAYLTCDVMNLGDNDKISVNLTLEVDRAAAGGNHLDYYLKKGYIKFKDMVGEGIDLEVGNIGAPINTLEEKGYKGELGGWIFRPLRETLTDQYGYLSSTITGVKLSGDAGETATWAVSLDNNSNYKAPETDDFKNLEFALAIKVNDNMFVGPFLGYGFNTGGDNSAEDWQRTRYGVVFGYCMEEFNFGAEVETGENGQGPGADAINHMNYSLWFHYFIDEKMTFVARIDSNEPDDDTDDDERMDYTVGIGYGFSKKCTFYAYLGYNTYAADNTEDDGILGILIDAKW